MFNLAEFLGCEQLAERFMEGTMVLARLCPLDYHSSIFLVTGLQNTPKEINGYFYSVNPIALHRNWKILSENRRVLTLLETSDFGTVAIVEIGATCVGEIYQTFSPDNHVHRGQEKGYFSFGGSASQSFLKK